MDWRVSDRICRTYYHQLGSGSIPEADLWRVQAIHIKLEAGTSHGYWSLFEKGVWDIIRAQILKRDDAILQRIQEQYSLLGIPRFLFYVFLPESKLHSTSLGIRSSSYWAHSIVLLLWVYEFQLPWCLERSQEARLHREGNSRWLGIPIRVMRQLFLGITLLVDLLNFELMSRILLLFPCINRLDASMGPRQAQEIQERFRRQIPKEQKSNVSIPYLSYKLTYN